MFDPTIAGPQVKTDEVVNQPTANELNDKPIDDFGINLDDQVTADLKLLKFKVPNIKKISNLEIQFAFVVSDLYVKDIYLNK
jgi:hypothetical protein